MNDTMELRRATLAKDLNDTTVSTNKNIIISIKGILPMVSILNSTIDINVFITETTDAASDNSDIKNTLIDLDYLEETGNDRFDYITSNISAVSKSKVMVYRDNKYDDLLIIPETTFLGSNANDDATVGETFTVFGYLVGGGDGNRGLCAGANVMPVEKQYMVKLPKVNTNIKSVNTQYSLPGINDDNKGSRYLERMITDKVNYSTSKSNLVGSLILGTNDDVFKTQAFLPHYVLYKKDMNLFALQFVGNKKIESTNSIHIFFNF